MGSEGDGIQPLVQKALDFRVFIPMYGQVSSLNVSQATSVMLHAAALQHRNMGDVKAS
jgi:tRNA G18 (ribose-2'-O)-methylase SpoU